MIACSRCQAQNEDSSLYCIKCGERLPAVDHQMLAEQLKERSRQLARENRSPAPLDILRDFPQPYKKNYPALSFISAILLTIGFVLCAGGLVGFGWVLINPNDAAGYIETQPGDPRNVDITPLTAALASGGNIFIASISGVAIYLGITSVAMAEALKLFMDLQENADRQSILLTMLLKKVRHDESEG